jgi:Rrf2 family protein
MAHLTASVEYAIHCLLWLTGPERQPLSSRDLATLQGISPSFLAKIFPKLEKAGIVAASEGLRGGYRLARAPEKISFLDIADAVEGRKPLFDCQEIRGRCALFGGSPPDWASRGKCSIHAAMLQVEKAMRDELARHSLADMALAVQRKAPAGFGAEIEAWIAQRADARTARSGGNPG